MELKLIKMILTDFRGLQSLEITPNGEDLTISGANKLGKTTSGDALCWQLTDKDMKGRTASKGKDSSKTFQLKPTNPDGSVQHHKECTVESFFLQDGEDLVLKKIFKEVHTKKRNDSKKSFTGNTNDHYINGLSVTSTKFNKVLGEIAAPEVFKMLLTPFYFSDVLGWKERMGIVLDISGDADDAAVVATNKKKLERFPSIVGKNERADVLKEKKVAKKKINDQIDKIPIQIKENSRDLPVITGIDPVAISKDIVRITKEVSEKTESIATLRAGGVSPELTSSLAKVQARITGHETTARNLLSEQGQTLRNELSGLQHKESAAKAEVVSLGKKKSSEMQTIAITAQRLNEYGLKFYTIRDDEVFKPVEGIVCDKCDVITPIDKQEAAFNVGKAYRLEEINKDGIALREHETETSERITDIDKQIAAQGLIAKTASSDIEKVEEKIAFASKQIATVVKMTAAHLADLDEKKTIDTDIEKANTGDTSELVVKVQGEIDALNLEKEELDKKTKILADHDKIEKRNKELMEEEDKLAEEFESIEADIYILEEFIKAKVSMLTPNIQSKFPGVKFKLFCEAINGGIEECCEVLVDGVAFGSANDADRANTGNKIINTLSEHYGVRVPTLVDRVESINNVEPSGSQMIKMVVTTDKELVFTNN